MTQLYKQGEINKMINKDDRKTLINFFFFKNKKAKEKITNRQNSPRSKINKEDDREKIIKLIFFVSL